MSVLPLPTRSAATTDAPMIDVAIANETSASIPESLIEAAVVAALAGSPYASGSISVAVVDNPTIRRLNVEFLQHDYETDVLSFALEAQPPRLVGEIIVSVEVAARCAQDVGWTADDELLLYVVHGALHLAGYRDKSPAAAAKMRAAEIKALAAIGVKPAADDLRWHEDDEEPVS